jgi:hypothetical protein
MKLSKLLLVGLSLFLIGCGGSSEVTNNTEGGDLVEVESEVLESFEGEFTYDGMLVSQNGMMCAGIRSQTPGAIPLAYVAGDEFLTFGCFSDDALDMLDVREEVESLEEGCQLSSVFGTHTIKDLKILSTGEFPKRAEYVGSSYKSAFETSCS